MTEDTTQEIRSKHEPIEMILARLLFMGSIVAAIMLAIGIVSMLLGNEAFATRLVTIGLVALMATPIMRVLTAGIIFVRERDWRFALFCLVVLCALAVGILLGHAHVK